MTSAGNLDGATSDAAKPLYESPRMTTLDVSATASGGAGALEATFPNFEPQSVLQAEMMGTS